MQETIAKRIRLAAEDVLQKTRTSPSTLGEALNEALRRLVAWPFQITAGSITDTDGNVTDNFETVIYVASRERTETQSEPLKSDLVAATIPVFNTLGIDELRTGYSKIGQAKRLRRTPKHVAGFPVADIPIGIIFALDCKDSIEELGEQMMELNKSTPSPEWPDMIVVLTRGTLNYAVQFEGDRIRGDFLLPNSTDIPIMPMYVHLFARGSQLLSFNRMCAILFMHLHIFSPGTRLGTMEEILEGIPNFGMTLGGYQFNLQHKLVPVPEDMQRDKAPGLRHLPWRIEDKAGNLLSHVLFIPWQEGGVIRVIGRLPLEAFLVFLGPAVAGAQRIKQENGEISSVLPIRQEDFRGMLVRMQRQSNLIIKPEQPSWTIAKIADEGSTSPFMARLFMNILRIRDAAFPDKDQRERFDKAYEFVVTALQNARSAARKIVEMLNEHKKRVRSGEIARVQGRAIHLTESIDRDLRKEVEDFLNSAVRVLKQGMQNTATALSMDIGFLFKQTGTFQARINELSKTRPELAQYLLEARKWSERLIFRRNSIEHEGWILPRLSYKETVGVIEVSEPEISEQPVSQFVDEILDRLCCFVEDVTVEGLKTQLPPEMSIREIEISKRKSEMPERFQLALTNGGTTLWKLSYHQSKFEET